MPVEASLQIWIGLRLTGRETEIAQRWRRGRLRILPGWLGQGLP
jgi:hypothetical protein